MAVETRVTFETSDSLWGGEVIAPSWNTFLGIGGDGPVNIPVDIGGPLNVWLPFVGDTELLRAGISGDVAARLGLDLNFAATLGELNAALPYDVSYQVPATLQPSSVFRLEGDYSFDRAASSFSTQSPGFAVWADLVFDLAADITGEVGVLGNNTSFTVLDFDVSALIPLFNWDSIPDDQESSFRGSIESDIQIGGSQSSTGSDGEIFGLDIAAIAENLLDAQFPIDPGSSITIPIGERGRGFSIDVIEEYERNKEAQEKTKRRSESESEENEDDRKEDRDKEDDSFLKSLAKEALSPEVSGSISEGALANLTLGFPFLELDGTPGADGVLSASDQSNPIAELNIDLDNMFVRLARAIGIPAPPLELAADFNASVGPFSAGIETFYNLFDADLNFGLPIGQSIDLTPDLFETRLSFFAADDDGESTSEAIYITTLMPRISVFFNENGTFQNDQVAAKLLELSESNASFANDIDLFVDLAEGIPGAFTGETGSISGGVIVRRDGGPWVQATTFAEETEWLARSTPFVGADPDLDSLVPRGNAEFRYVIYDQNSVVDADGVVDLSTIPVDRVFDLAFTPSEDGIFQARQDYVEAPITTTEFVEGTPSLDLVFPAGRDKIAVEVEHRTEASVANRTTLDFTGDLALEALAFGIEAYAEALGFRAALGFEFGPLWEETFPLFDVEIAPLFDEVFRIRDDQFNANGSGGARTSRGEAGAWSFLLDAEGEGDASIIDALEDDDRNIRGTARLDTVSFALAGGASPDVTARLRDDLADLQIDGTPERYRLQSIDNVVGTRGNDRIEGDVAANSLDGGEGRDRITAFWGSDTIVGGFGDDILDPGDGRLLDTNDGNDTVYGGAGFDRVFVSTGDDLLDGGTSPAVGTSGLETVDLDVLDFSRVPGRVRINVENNAFRVIGTDLIGDQTYLNFEGYAGTRGNDAMIGSAERDYFEGGEGQDRLVGENLEQLSLAERRALRGDNDRLYGEGGDDILIGGPGADLLDGGAGTDTVEYIFAPTSVFVSLDAPIELDPELFQPLRIPAGAPDRDYTRTDGQGWRGWAQGDKLRDVENINGSLFDDILFGDTASNTIFGSKGNDRIAGGGGNDVLRGADDDDIIWRSGPAAITQATADASIDALPDATNAQFATGSRPAESTITPSELGLGAVSESLLDGGKGFDLVLTDTGQTLQFELDLRFVERRLEGGIVPSIAADVDLWRVRLQSELPTAVEGSLPDGSLVTRAVADGEEKALFVTGFRAPGQQEFTTFAPVMASDWFANPATTGGPSVNGARFFWDRPTAFENTIETEISRDRVLRVEGLSGTMEDDRLLGDAAANAIYGAGGIDDIDAGDGNDRIGYGQVQRALELFSFPGQPSVPGGRVNRETDAGLPTVQADLVDRILLDYLAAPASLERLGTLREAFEDYEVRTTFSNGTVRVENPLADRVFLDGGRGRDTLDLRFDRGIDLLPVSSTESAYVDLGSSSSPFSPSSPFPFIFNDGSVAYGEAVWRPAGTPGTADFNAQESLGALFLGIEDVIGSDNGDEIYGDARNNRIEGAGGADTLDGRGGFDTLSYANADEGVTLVINQDGGFDLARGESRGDVLSNFEAILGSAHEDTLGLNFVVGSAPTVFVEGGFSNPEGISRISAGGGDDLLLVAASEVDFRGGAGDDRFVVQPLENRELDLVPNSLLNGRAEVNGGDGIDIATWAFIGEGDLSASNGGFGQVTLTNTLRGQTVVREFSDIEYLRFGDVGQTLSLKNLDPLVATGGNLSLGEDPSTAFGVVIEGLENLEIEGRARIDRLPEGGVLSYIPDGGRARQAAAEDDRLTKTELATLQFAPGQDFALPLGASGLVPDAPIQGNTLTKAALNALTFSPSELGRATGTSVEFKIKLDGAVQTRRIAIDPQPLDGAGLGIEMPTDGAERISTIASDSFASQTQAARFDGSEFVPLDMLPQSRLGAEQSYTVRSLPQGARLVSVDPETGLERELRVGDQINGAETQIRLFGEDGIIPAGAEIGFSPDEILEVVVVRTPVIGEVFNPTVALDVALPDGAEPDQAFRITATPDDGTLFYRDMGGDPVTVTAGDSLTEDQIAGLHFTADRSRSVTDSDPSTVAATTDVMNRPTELAVEEVGRVGLAPDQDPTALTVIVESDAPALPEIDGLTIDLDQAGSNIVRPWREVVDETYAVRNPTHSVNLSGLREIEWVQRGANQGGAGELYAVSPEDSTALEVERLVEELKFSAGSGRLGTYGLRVATVGDGAENQFIFDLANRTEGAFSGNFGPILGASQSVVGGPPAEDWVWNDGTEFDFTAWRDGEPNDSGGTVEDRLQFSRVLVSGTPGEDAIYRPTWNDTLPNVNRQGFALEARALASDENDLIRGSDADTGTEELIFAGAGDDVVLGRGGQETIFGGSGDDWIAGGTGDDMLTGGAGEDIFIFGRNGGTDVITDFRSGGARDLIDVGDMDLGSFAELQATYVPELGGTALTAHNTTIFLSGFELGASGDGDLTVLDFVGLPIHLSDAMPGMDELSLRQGDRIHADELSGLRYRADFDQSGDAGRFIVDVLDPWALPDGVDALGGDDPRADTRDGVTRVRVGIDLDAQNDAPRSADRSYAMTVNGSFEGRAAELRLTATDPEGGTVSFTLARPPENGTVMVSRNGAFTYQPDRGFEGTDTFEFAVSDGADMSTHTVQMLVLPRSEERRVTTDSEVEDGFRLLFGFTTDDNLGGSSVADRLLGSYGDDRLRGFGGNDRLLGEDGDDTLVGGGGNDLLNGGRGEDTAVYSGAARVRVNLADASFQDTGLGRDKLISVEHLRTGDGRDIVFGNALANRIETGGGDDIVRGGGGADAMFGARGDDRLFGEAGADDMEGGIGDDLVVGGSGDDLMRGGAGSDIMLGASGNDRIFGDEGNDRLRGMSGNDMLAGGGGADLLLGEAGNDTLSGGDGGDRLVGLSGRDVIGGGAGADALFGGSEDDILRGGAGNDVINGGANNDLIAGNQGNDTLLGASGSDEILGDEGADRLRGQGGNDTLFGGTGNDLLFGEAGRDTLDGGAGDDLMSGGAGRDSFMFSGNLGSVRITDFDAAQGEILDFSANASVGSMADLRVLDRGANTVISAAGEGSIILVGVDSADVGSDSFVF
ncbi:MAG: Ig-like domain-containing protein [Pseudomonadota bacterium]